MLVQQRSAVLRADLTYFSPLDGAQYKICTDFKTFKTYFIERCLYWDTK